ncbi:MAG: hypothetical protein O2923_03110 [Verrucomicrobia bacterium]|nr:hypothetical protein [Verrucomicrobiota bacterium]MDA1088555.1 hypothetical protein [Verrucomicrobiota bacterium]
MRTTRWGLMMGLLCIGIALCAAPLQAADPPGRPHGTDRAARTNAPTRGPSLRAASTKDAASSTEIRGARVEPAQVLFLPRDAAQLRIVFLELPTEPAIALSDAVPPADTMRCVIIPGARPGTYRIRVIAEWLAGVDGDIGDLLLKTDNPNKFIRIPVAVEAASTLNSE